MKTLQQCQSEVAKKYGLGSKLVTGHMVKYFNEASEMYANQFGQRIYNKIYTDNLIRIYTIY